MKTQPPPLNLKLPKWHLSPRPRGRTQRVSARLPPRDIHDSFGKMRSYIYITQPAPPPSGCRHTADIDSSSDCQYERSYEIVRRTRQRPCASGFGLVDPSSASIRCASSTARFIVVLRSPFLNEAARGPPRALLLTVLIPTAACSSLAHAHYLKAAQLTKRHLTPI